MATFGKLEGRITFSTNQTGSITDSGGSAGWTVAAGSYYLSSADADGGSSLIEAFQTALNTASPSDTITVTLGAGENGTGLVAISSSGTVAITWTTTPIRDVLGFAYDLTAAASQTAIYHARSLWLPNVPFLNLNGGGQWRGWIESDLRVVENMAGYVWAHSGQRKRVAELAWQGIKRSKCWVVNESTLKESFEQFYIDVIHGEAAWTNQPAGPIRFYPDAASDYVFGTYKLAGGVEMFKPDQLFQNYGGQWVLRLPRMVQVPGTEDHGIADTIEWNLIGEDIDNADASSYVTDTINGESGALVLACIGSTRASAVESPTLSGGGVTWTLVTSKDVNSGTRRISVYRALGTVSGAITITFSATHTACGWSFMSLTGIDTSGTNGSGAIRASTSTSTAAGTSLTTTLAPFTTVKNYNVTAFMTDNGGTTITGDADFTTVSSWETATPAMDFLLVAAENEQACTNTVSGSVAAAQISIEIKAAT